MKKCVNTVKLLGFYMTENGLHGQMKILIILEG